MKFLLIDGTNLLCQMFFGMPARITGKDGRLIHGAWGFIGALIRIIKIVGPTHLLVMFDGEHDNPRGEIDGDYKANRPGFADVPEAENPFSQLPDIYAALDHMGIIHAETAVCEADDVIAAYAIAYNSAAQITISSFDSDFFQLVNDNTTILRYRGDKTALCGEQFILEKFGVSPGRYADFKSLTGDASDNIKGAEKVGVKTAAALLRQFECLESVIKRYDEIQNPSVRESIKRNAERLRKNYRLIKLDGKAGMPFTPDELKYAYNGAKTAEIIKAAGIIPATKTFTSSRA